MAQAAERPFEGRERELDSLAKAWQLTCDGAGQVATVSAADGVGKSRLIEVFVDRTAGEARAVLICRCSKQRRFTAFSPFVDLLHRLRADLDRSNAQGAQTERPGGSADPADRLRATLIARLTALVSPTRRHRASALNLNPEGRARKTLEELLGLFMEGAKRLPLLLVIEDLDWADPSTLALLELLVQRRLHVPWMTVLTFTPKLESPWSHRGHVTALELPRLSRREEEALFERLTVGQEIEPTWQREAIARADGTPLFLEEQARLIRQMDPSTVGNHKGGRSREQCSPLPTILKHWLAKRLERLGEAQDVARAAAVMGEELSRPQLASLLPLDAACLEDAIERLVGAKVLVRPGPSTDLAFSHGLVREAIHDLIPEQPRQELHRQVVEVLSQPAEDGASHGAGKVLAQPDLERIAYHHREAGMAIEAASSWLQAAEQAVDASANLEAAERAQQGLVNLETAADNEDKRALEIKLWIVQGAALGTAKGFAAADAVAAYERALELAWQAPSSANHFQALQELTSYFMSRGHISTAYETADRALKGLDEGDVETLPVAQRALGFAKLLKGDFISAEADLKKSIAPYAVHRSLLQAMPPGLGIPMAATLSHLVRRPSGFSAGQARH